MRAVSQCSRLLRSTSSASTEEDNIGAAPPTPTLSRAPGQCNSVSRLSASAYCGSAKCALQTSTMSAKMLSLKDNRTTIDNPTVAEMKVTEMHTTKKSVVETRGDAPCGSCAASCQTRFVNMTRGSARLARARCDNRD